MRRFLCATKELRSNSSAQKMWQRKNAQRAQARLRFFVARAADRQRSAYSPVRRWFFVLTILYFIFHLSIVRLFFNTFFIYFDSVFTSNTQIELLSFLRIIRRNIYFFSSKFFCFFYTHFK